MGLSGAVAISDDGLTGLALLANGTVAGFGPFIDESVGNPSPTGGSAALVTGLSSVKAVSDCGAFEMALLTNGTVVTWGNNDFGELGLGSDSPSLSTSIPTVVPGLSRVKHIACSEEGENFAFATQ